MDDLIENFIHKAKELDSSVEITCDDVLKLMNRVKLFEILLDGKRVRFGYTKNSLNKILSDYKYKHKNQNYVIRFIESCDKNEINTKLRIQDNSYQRDLKRKKIMYRWKKIIFNLKNEKVQK